jgi:nucleotide-binding universal stress UspA family protein
VLKSVVVGATDSQGSARAFQRALEVARASGGTLHVVSALAAREKPLPYLPEEFRYTEAGAGTADWLLGRLRAEAAADHVNVETHPVLADPAEAIARVAAAEHADLVVVGSGSAHGGRGLSGVPKAVIDTVPCAVLVV